jgi:hypothetical protein
MSQGDLVYPHECSICGRVFFIERTLDLARRVESVAGSLDLLARKIDAGQATFTDLARVYAALLRDQPDAPTAADLDAWLFARGVYLHRQTAAFLMSLAVGTETLAREAARMNLRQDPKAEEGDVRSPFARTGASIGNTSSASPH